MRAIDPSAWVRQIRPIIGALKAPVIRTAILQEEQPPPTPFITISREVGAGAHELAHRLVEHLNEVDPGEVPWTAWDRELVEKVAADHNISQELIESLGTREYNWLTDLIEGFAITDTTPSEETVVRNVFTTVRALAQAGRVVIVGMGTMLITRRMRGGVHVRLIAPFEARVRAYAQRNGLPLAEAEAEVRRLEKSRAAFYARYWPSHKIDPELFHLTLNVARLSEQQMVDCIAPLVVTGRKQRQAERIGELAGI
mgnify:CR=1 FL=1